MQLNLQYTTKLDKKYIKEALKLEDTHEAQSKNWKFIGQGVYKSVYKKGKIVVKFALYNSKINVKFTNSHMRKEAELYYKVRKHDKKYFARVFGGDKNKIIQRFILKSNKKYNFADRGEFQDLIDKYAVKYNIDDAEYGHNIYIVNGKPVFYDYGM